MRVNTLIRMRKNKLLNKVIYHLLLNKGVDLPSSVIIGKNVSFPHNSFGTVIHDKTIIEDNVRIYQNVTLGRADIQNKSEESKMQGILIKKGAIICAGAKIICKEGTLIVGKNTIIGANAVLMNSTGDNEVWAGIPAKRIK